MGEAQMAQESIHVEVAAPLPACRRPLVVDMDGTLVRSDLLIETALSEFARRPQSAVDMLKALRLGKAALKQCAASSVEFDASALPYDEAVLKEIEAAQKDGRQVYLASAASERIVRAVADHLGVFDGYIGSDATTNCSGTTKAAKLVAVFGEGRFDYIGNDADDLAVWSKCGTAIAIRTSGRVSRRLAAMPVEKEYLPHQKPSWRTWARLLRVHQYTKNLLLLVPLLASHQLTAENLIELGIAFLSFCLCASSVYIINDLVDLQADRAHPTKRHRPLAEGRIQLIHALLAAPLLLIASFILATGVSPAFFAVLLGYFVLTTAYSFYLKRKMLIDVVTLAMLYTVRIIAGAIAIGVHVSPWLLTFAIFIFLALALVKRYAELATRLDLQLSEPSNRNYKFEDLGVVAAFAAAAGYNSVTVFALYISSPDVNVLYQRPQMLWFVCPVLIYWTSRLVMIAHRRSMTEDPIVFAMTDRNSLLSFLIAGLAVVAAV
ncbi:UbiA family prenyltransferase [Mesorhizobium sp.]|uniref:UbiA family prenyltransferase n=1 Tax=Mesorhizobium sp. TaxID=1871066 RepID=UPI00257D3401|nr:UbiA family prenyltransferase [Mesorhizobium sp.]